MIVLDIDFPSKSSSKNKSHSFSQSHLHNHHRSNSILCTSLFSESRGRRQSPLAESRARSRGGPRGTQVGSSPSRGRAGCASSYFSRERVTATDRCFLCANETHCGPVPSRMASGRAMDPRLQRTSQPCPTTVKIWRVGSTTATANFGTEWS